jgi:tRNA A-37 threonylcarbamoyl transferase component Bud32
MNTPGALIATGRDADIFEYGNGAVLRRSRNGRSQVHEAKVMIFVRSNGYPVPEVFEVSDDGVNLIMERIEGPTMIEAAASQPGKLNDFGHDLAELHQSLHLMIAPEWFTNAPCGSGEHLLHMDLHPLNVILSPSGPVVIDWTNAARGNPLVDVAATWVLLASASVPGGHAEKAMAEFGRDVLVKAFLSPFSKAELSTVLESVVEWKCKDPHMSATEIERMRSMVNT